VEYRVEHEVDGHDVGDQAVALGPLLGLLNEGDLLPRVRGCGSCLLSAVRCKKTVRKLLVQLSS
jgi:hypothetical protein